MLLLVDKPSGITSFDVIRRLRKEFSVKKMGHAGTLDPMATGLMLVGVGEGTKELAKLIGLPKVYEAEIKLGVKTDTGDITGAVVESCKVKVESEEQIKEILTGMIGELKLTVPAYSAIKQGGVPLYKKARRGEAVAAPVRVMKILWIKPHEFSSDTVKIELEVSSGTYIRSIAEEIGLRLGTVATLSALRRTKIGEFKVESARKI